MKIDVGMRYKDFKEDYDLMMKRIDDFCREKNLDKTKQKYIINWPNTSATMHHTTYGSEDWFFEMYFFDDDGNTEFMTDKYILYYVTSFSDSFSVFLLKDN